MANHPWHWIVCLCWPIPFDSIGIYTCCTSPVIGLMACWLTLLQLSCDTKVSTIPSNIRLSLSMYIYVQIQYEYGNEFDLPQTDGIDEGGQPFRECV